MRIIAPFAQRIPQSPITSIHLMNVSADRRSSVEVLPGIMDIGLVLPLLKTLRVTGHIAHTWSSLSTKRNLSDGLAQLRHLTTLDLDLRVRKTQRFPTVEFPGLLGPQNILVLAGLPVLRTAKLPLAFIIARDLPGAFHHQVPSPNSVLPRSLIHLTMRIPHLQDLWYLYPMILDNQTLQYKAPSTEVVEDSRWQPRAALLKFLEELAANKPGSFPDLQTVAYEWCTDGCHFDDKPTWDATMAMLTVRALSPYVGFVAGFDKRGASTKFQSRFETLKASFGRRGVRFSTKAKY